MADSPLTATANNPSADPLGSTLLSRPDFMMSPQSSFGGGQGMGQMTGGASPYVPGTMPGSGGMSYSPFVATQPGITSALNYSGSQFLLGAQPVGSTVPQMTQFGGYLTGGGLPGGATDATGALAGASGNAIGGNLSPNAQGVVDPLSAWGNAYLGGSLSPAANNIAGAVTPAITNAAYGNLGPTPTSFTTDYAINAANLGFLPPGAAGPASALSTAGQNNLFGLLPGQAGPAAGELGAAGAYGLAGGLGGAAGGFGDLSRVARAGGQNLPGGAGAVEGGLTGLARTDLGSAARGEVTQSQQASLDLQQQQLESQLKQQFANAGIQNPESNTSFLQGRQQIAQQILAQKQSMIDSNAATGIQAGQAASGAALTGQQQGIQAAQGAAQIAQAGQSAAATFAAQAAQIAQTGQATGGQLAQAAAGMYQQAVQSGMSSGLAMQQIAQTAVGQGLSASQGMMSAYQAAVNSGASIQEGIAGMYQSAVNMGMTGEQAINQTYLAAAQLGLTSQEAVNSMVSHTIDQGIQEYGIASQNISDAAKLQMQKDANTQSAIGSAMKGLGTVAAIGAAPFTGGLSLAAIPVLAGGMGGSGNFLSGLTGGSSSSGTVNAPNAFAGANVTGMGV